MAQTNIAGLSRQAKYQFLVKSYSKQIIDVTKGYESFFDQIFGEEAAGFFDTVGDIVSLPFTVVYSGIKGGFEGLVGLAQSVNLILTNFVNDMARTFDESDGVDWTNDLNYALTNLTTTVGESVLVNAISFAGNVGGLFGIDPNWAYGEDGLIDTVADTAMLLRYNALKPGFKGANSLFLEAFGDNSKNLLAPEGNLDTAADKARETVDARYYDATKQWIKGSIDVQNWVNKNFVIPPINEFVFGWAKNNTDAAFGDQTWYQGLKGTSESIGNILASWGVAKLAGKIGLSSTGQQVAASSYFAGSIFGNSFNEAYTNGASIQDAYTYATGIALTETAIEQIGGFKPGEWAGESLFKFLTKPGTWRKVLNEANQEGWEEVASQFLGTGMSYYGSGKNQETGELKRIEPEKIRKGFDFLGDAFGAYLGGFASSFLLGSGRKIFTRNTLNTQLESVQELFEQDVTEFGEEKAVEQLNKRLEKLVETLNKKDVKGIKFNKRGGTTSGVLTKAELAETLNLAGLSRVLTFEPTMKDPEAGLPAQPVDKALERGLGKFVLDKNQKINKDFFKNKMTVSEGGQKKQVVVQEGVFAHNKATKGVDLSDGGKVNPIGVDNQNDKGRKVLQVFANSKAPVVIYEGNPNESGYYNRKNGVVYINQNANIDIQELLRETFVHETTHLISKNAPGQFNELKELVNQLVVIKLNATKNGLEVEFKDKRVEKYFKDNNIDLQKLISDSFNEMVLPESEGGQGLPIQRALLNVQEELVAYFVEAVATNKSVLDLIKNTKVSLVERVSDFFQERAERQGDFGGAAGSIGKVVSTLKTAAQEGLSRAQSIKNYVDYAFGTDNFRGFIKSKILGKYDEEDILDAIINRQFDLEAQTITIKGEVFPISEVFNDKGPEGNLKRWVEKGNDLYKAGVLIFNKLTIDQKNVQSVISNVEKWIKTAEKKQTDPDTIDEDKAEISKYIRFADLALEQLEKYKKSKSTEAFKFADAKTARGQEIKSNLLKQSISVALAELELNKKTTTQSPVAEKVTVEVDPAVKAKLIQRKEAAVNLLNRILKRFNFTANSAFPGWVRNVNTQKQEFYISLFKSVETVKDERKNKTKPFEPFSVGQSKQDIENLTQQIVDIISIEVARMYPPIKGPNGEDIIQFTVTHNGLAMSEFDATQETYLKGVEIVIQPTQELLDLTVGEIAEKEENANKTPEEKAIEQPQKVGERQKNFNLLLETSKGMVENLVNNVKNILKEVGVAFEKVKVFTNTKGSDKGVFDTNVKDLGIQADNVEGVETEQKTSQTNVDDALGKNFKDFMNAYSVFAQQNDGDMEYNLQDAVGEATTPFGTYTSDGSILGAELYVWAEYLEFLQLFPEFQNKTFNDYFEYIKSNPNWAEEARKNLNLPTTVGELKEQQEAEPLEEAPANPMTEEEKNVIRDALGMNLERIRQNKLSVNKIKALLPERYRDKFTNLTFLGDGSDNILKMDLGEGYELNSNPGAEDIEGIQTDEQFIQVLENITPLFSSTPKVSLEKLQEISVKIDDELIDISSKIQEWFQEQRVKERPEEPNENSEIFQRNEDLIASIDSLQVGGIMVEGKEFGLFDELTAFLEENYVPVRIIDKVTDPISVISEFFSELSRIKEELSDLAKKPQEKINEGLLAQILNLQDIKEKFDNAKSELEEIFGITDLNIENILPVVSGPKQGFDVIEPDEETKGKILERIAKAPLANAEYVASDFGPFGKKKPSFEEVLEIPEARKLIDVIEGSLDIETKEKAKALLSEKFGYDYKEAKQQDRFDAELEAYFKKQDERFAPNSADNLVRFNQGYPFDNAQKSELEKLYPVGTVVYEEFSKDYYIVGGASRETIRYIKETLDKKIRSGEEIGSRIFDKIIKDTGVTPGGLSKVLTLLRDLENQSRFETTPSGLKNYVSYRTLTEIQRIIPTFDKNNIVIGMPQANAESVQKAVEEAFKVSPIVAFVVPATWNKYKQQSVIPSNKKLIAWTANGLQKVITGEGQPPINVKTITQIWVDSTDERFVEYEDLRAIDEIKTKSDPFYTSKTLAGVKETYDKLVEAGEEFDLIVRSVGFNEQTDFNQKFTKLSEISPTQTYIAIKINDPTMKDMYLGYLNQIDLNELAKKAPTLRLGFTAEDLAKEFIALVEKSVNNNGKLKKITGMNVNEEQRKRIRDLFGDNIVRDFFVVDKKGNLVLSNAAIAQRSYKQRAAKINGQVYTGKDYAMNVLQDLTSKDIQLDPEDILVKNEELNEEEKKVIDFFKLLGINFVVYKSDQGKNVGGYTIPGPGQTLVFINKSQLLKQPFINEVIIHEFLHQLFLYQPGMMMNFASSLADVLLNPDGTESDIYKQITDKFGTKGFIAYIKQYGKQNPEFKKIKTVQDIVNVLKDAKNNLEVANELIAQLGGILFTDEKVFQTLLNAGDNAKLFSFYNVYSSVITDTRIPKNLRDATKNLLNKISPVIDERLKEIEKIYPKTRTYTIAELNNFISQFTNGQFTTKKELIEASLEEKANNKRGKATIALDNIIFVSSLFARTVKQNAEVFGLLQKEFSAYKTSVEYILDNPESILTGEKTKIFSFFKSIFSFPKTFASVIKKAQEAAEDKTGPKVYFNEAEASADGGNVMVGFDILPTKLLDNQIQSLYDFLDEYETLDDNLLIIMGLPSKAEIGDMVEELIKAHEKTLDSMFKKGSKYKDSFTPALEKFKSMFGKQFAEAKVQFSKGSENSFKKLIDLQVKARNSKIDLVATVMKNKLNATIQRIRAQPLQAQSPVNRNIQDLANLISQIISILENQAFDSKTMLLEINAVMKQIVGFLNAQYVDKDGKPIGNVIDSEEAKSQFITSIVVIYKQLASLIGKELMDKKNKTDPYSILNENTPNNPFGIPLSVNDLSVIGETFVNLTDPKYTILRPFSEAQFAKQFANILRLFETKYDSSLSDTPVTHNEYAKILADEINKVDDAGGKLPNLKASGLSLEKLSNVMLPQDFFKLMDSIFGPQGISLFRNFFREYVRATLRRSDILQMFDIEYTRWIKSHKENQKKSVREKVNLDSTILAQMPKGKLQKIDDQVKEEVNALKEQQREISKKITAFGVKIKGLTEKIQEIKEKLKRTSKGDKSREILKKQLETLQDEKRKAMSLRTNERGNKQKLAAQAQSLNPVVLKTIKIREFVAAQGKKIKQTISRGHLVSLYLSVVREQEMHDAVQAGMGEEIYPTEHFAFGNQFNILDNERLRKFGWLNAEANQLGFTIVAQDRPTLIAYLETLLSEEDIQNIEFAKERFDANYEMLDEMFFQRYKVHLPRQNTYIPFASSESDYKREFKLKQANRYNIAAPDGMVTATTSGARTILRIENIFSVIENHTQDTANYSFERLVTDWQNLFVNGSGGSTLQSILTDGTVFGKENGILSMVENSLLAILQYNDITESWFTKLVKQVIRNTVAATMSLNLISSVKQLASVSTVILKNGIQIVPMLKNVSKALFLPSKYRRWLMGVNPTTGKPNNSNFYFRAKVGNVAALSEQLDTRKISQLNGVLGKVTNFLALPVGWTDNSILVGAFASLVEKVQKENPNISEEEAFQRANVLFQEVLLYGVANTDTAFRSRYSNRRGAIDQMISRYQSENVMQISALLADRILVKNKTKGSRRKYLRDMLAFLLSALFSALTNNLVDVARGRVSQEDASFEFWVNELLMDNILGSVPYLNILTNAIEFDPEKVVEAGIEPKLPLISELYASVDLVSQIINSDTDPSRKVVKLAEVLGQVFGVPVRNVVKTSTDMVNLFAPKSTSVEVMNWYMSRTPAQGLTAAVINGDKKAVEVYLEDKFSNTAVQNEIADLLASDTSLRLSLRDDDSFVYKNKTYEIPDYQKDKYNRFAQKALQKLINKGSYRRLSNKNKIKAIQRIINYYSNYMRAVISQDRDELNSLAATEGFEDVIERALKFDEEDE